MIVLSALLSSTFKKRKIGKWLSIPAALAVLCSVTLEATATHDSGLFITSFTILALVSWITAVSVGVMGVSRILK